MSIVDAFRLTLAVAVALGAAVAVGCIVLAAGVGLAVARAWREATGDAAGPGGSGADDLTYSVGRPCGCGWREATEAEATAS